MKKNKEWERSRIIWGIIECDMRMEFSCKGLYQKLGGLLWGLMLVHCSVLQSWKACFEPHPTSVIVWYV